MNFVTVLENTSHRPKAEELHEQETVLVEARGVEPLTSGLQSQRSPS